MKEEAWAVGPGRFRGLIRRQQCVDSLPGPRLVQVRAGLGSPR